MRLSCLLLLMTCTATWSMQNFVSNDPQFIERFIQGLKSQVLAQANNPWAALGSQSFLREFLSGAGQPCNCPADQQQQPQSQQDQQQPQQQQFGTRSSANNNNAPRPQTAAPQKNNYNNNNNVVQNTGQQQSSQSTKELSTKLMPKVAAQMPHSNVMYSPLSLEVLLIFVTLGARGQTSQELHNTLKLPNSEQQIINMAVSKQQQQHNTPGAQVFMANKMYYADNLEPENNISQAAKYMQTEFEPTNFAAPMQTADNINGWVAGRTQNRIQNLIAPNTLNDQTESILVNAIYFKGKWAKEFSTSDTETRQFQNSDGQVVPVDMMFVEEMFRYGEFPSMGAKVIELPYNESDMSMMIMLPDQPQGLNNMERAMSNMDLNQISQQLKPRTVSMRMPRFQFDCDLDMVQPLMQMGIRQLFSDNADLSGMFRNKKPKVSRVQTKAYLEVNEAGTEAAAASFYKLVPLSLPPKITQFTVDHPFMFAIRSPNAIFFMGHVNKM